ncbi:TonB-dependent receptor [Bacteroides sp. 519]|nr:TonB-dependent receptor [Bacteroides sp. 519]
MEVVEERLKCTTFVNFCKDWNINYIIMKRTKLLLAFLLYVLSTTAQSVTGVITDAQQQPIEYANVVLLVQQDSTFIAGAVTDAGGNFTISASVLTVKPCLIQITNIGYKTTYQPIQAGHIGTIILEADTQMLDEVVVKGNLPVTRLKAGAMITNIEGSVLAQTGTAQDMLNYIPGVASQKGSLQVLGRGTPVVYINGRLMRDSSELDQLSADNIKSVEVINNPGAKYDASVKAVIRIQTKKPVGEGFGFSNRTFVDYDDKYWDALEQVNLNYRTGGLDIFGMLFLYQYKDWHEFTLTQDSYLDKHWNQLFQANGYNKTQNLIADFGMNYAWNSKHSVGFKYRYDRTPKGRYFSNFDTAIKADDLLYENSQSVTSLDGQDTQNSINMYYNGTVNDWDIDFNTDLLWTDEHEKQDAQETITPVTGTGYAQQVTTTNKTKNRLYASKLILAHPLLGGNFSFGGEFSYTNRTTNYRNKEGVLENDDNEIKEKNTAAFVEYSRELGNLQLQAGLRYEHVVFDYYDEGVLQNEQSKKYDNLFPSLSASMPIGNAQLQLSYAQDIERPGFYSLRSSIYYANHYTYETGNPFLRPSISHNVSLTGVYKYWQVSAAYARRENDVILSTVPYSEENPNIVLFKPINSKSYNTAYLTINATPTIGFWSPRFTVMLQKQWYTANTAFGMKDFDRPRVYMRWQNTFKLPANILFNLNTSWSSKYNTLNTYINKTSWGIDAGLSKSFFNDRLTAQLNGYDIFLTRRSSRISYEGTYYVMGKNETPNMRSVRLTIRYRFNQGRNKYKGTGAGESQKNRL